MLICFSIFFPMAAGLALFFLSGRYPSLLLRGPWIIALGEVFLTLILLLFPQHYDIPWVLLGGLHFQTENFRVIYGLIAAALWLGTTLFSREYFLHEPDHLRAYWAYIFLTLGAVEGLFLSDDFMTAFCFFEMLSLFSFPWVMHERNPEAVRAGCTYLAVAIISGLVLFMGLLILYFETGTLTYRELSSAVSTADITRVRAAGVCIMLGFGAKAGMFPLHVWLPKAHPVAPAPASALLSGMLTKAGIYGILMTGLYFLSSDRVFGQVILVLGLITMFLGAVMALFSVNLKHTLACSSMSQIGFILTGIGSAVLVRGAEEPGGVALALNGTVAHMVNHSLLKLVLFLSAGAVAMNLHTLDVNEMRGWGRNKHLLKAIFLLAALGISGVPGFNGYLSKTLLHEGLTEAIHSAGVWWGAEWIFLMSGGMTFAYMLKLFICIFVEQNSDPARQAEFDRSTRWGTSLSQAVLSVSALVLLPLGFKPTVLSLGRNMAGIAVSHFAPFGVESLWGGMISLSIGAVLYLVIVRQLILHDHVYRHLWPRWLDLEDSVYRPLLLSILPSFLSVPARLLGENLILKPVCRGIVLLGTVLGRAMDTGTDWVILVLRRTVLRETPVKDGPSSGHKKTKSVFLALADAFGGIVDNFSYAMMLVCSGIVLIFILLLIFL